MYNEEKTYFTDQVLGDKFTEMNNKHLEVLEMMELLARRVASLEEEVSYLRQFAPKQEISEEKSDKGAGLPTNLLK